jgi:hypothetical protein
MRHYIDVVLVDDGSTLPEAQAYLKVRWCNLGTRVTRVTLNPKPKTQNPKPYTATHTGRHHHDNPDLNGHWTSPRSPC